MKVPVAAVLVVLLVWSPQLTSGQRFVPLKCRDICKNGFQDVSAAADAFLNIDHLADPGPGVTKPKFITTRASTWAVSLLRVVSLAANAAGCWS